MATTFWNPSNKTNSTLSNGNRTDTASASNGQVVSNTSQSSGKWYFEIVPSASLSGNGYFGVVANGSTYTAGSNSGGTNLGLIQNDGGEQSNGGAFPASLGALGTKTIRCCVDIPNALMWMTFDTSTWNGSNFSGTGNPVTGVGGITIVVGTGLAIIAQLNSASDAITLNTKTSEFNFSPPSGFLAWDTPTSPSGTWATTEAKDVFAGLGYSGSPGTKVSIASTENPDTFAALGYVAAVGTLATTEQGDVFSAYGRQPLTGAWHTTEAQDIFAGLGYGRGANGTMILTENPDVVSIHAFTPPVGTMNMVETPDRFQILGVGVSRVRRRRPVNIT